MSDSASLNLRERLQRMAISAIVTFMVGALIMSSLRFAGLGMFGWLLCAFAGGITVSVLFPEIWAVGPLLLIAIDVMAFIRAMVTEGISAFPVAVVLLLAWLVVAYVGAAIGILISRRRRVSRVTP